MNLGLSFLRGLVAAVNPCGFVLLPTYLMYFLGLEAGRPMAQRASVRRALVVAGAVSAGFMAVFVVAGAISKASDQWLERNAKYATVVIGVGLIALGAAMLFGYRLPLATPAVGTVATDRRDRTVRSMFLYGIAYAVASISCTIGLFIATMFTAGERDGIRAGVANGAAYAAGMALLVTALTVTLAFANQALLRSLRSTMRYADRLAAAFVLLSGTYLLYYFWVVDVNERSDSITTAVERLQNWVLVRLNDNWQVVAVVLATVVAGAVAYVAFRRRPPDDGAPLRSAARDREVPTPT